MPVVTGIRLSALAELLSAAVTDELFIRDESEPAVTESKRIAVSNLLAAYDALVATLTNKTLDADNNTVTNIGASEVKADLITGQTELAVTPDSTDEALLSDAGVLKRISLANLLALYNALTATLTNKTIDADNNTLSNIGAAEIIADLITGQVELAVAPDGSDEVLINDGGVLKRISVTNFGGAVTTSPAGSDGQVQYNNGGSFGGAAQLYYDDVNNRVRINESVPIETLHINGNLQVDGDIKKHNSQLEDMGAERESARDGRGYRYITDHLFANCWIGSNALTRKGALRVVDSPIETFEMYLNGAWQDFLADLTMLDSELIHTPLTEAIDVRSGNSNQRAANGLPVIQEYKVSMGAMPVHRIIDGGSF